MRQILTRLTLVLSVMLLTKQTFGQCSPDILPPTITTCPPSATFFVDAAPAGSCVHTITSTEQSVLYPGASDNCTPPPSLTYQLTYYPNGLPSVGPVLNPVLTGIQLPPGPNLFVWRIVDAAGNISAQCFYTITVVDNTPPSITCGVTGAQNVTAAANCKYAAPAGWNATATDNCLVNSLTYALTGATTGTGTNISGVEFNLGTTTVTWTATDNATPANTSTCSFTVVVTDVTPPVLTCNNTTNQNLNTDAGECNYTQTGSGWNASATDNCTVISVLANLTGATTASNLATLTGQDFSLGTTTVTWTATDGAGNTTTCSFTVTVSDIVPPVVTTCPANQTVSMNPNTCTYTHTGITWNPVATDNCTFTMAYALTGATVLPSGGSTLNGQVFNPGVTTVTWTITDIAGNTASCVYTVTVNDTQNPTITCGVTTTQNIILSPGVCTYTHSGTAWDATASDNCTLTSLQYALSGVSSGTGTSLAGVVFNLGTTTVTWTATDNSGNTTTCSFNVVVTDNELPVITCVSNQPVNMDAGQCTYTQPDDSWNATASDNCTVSSITYALTGATTGTGTTLNGVAFNFGVTTVTWTATDNSSNTATCSFTVTVADNQIPTITCVADQPFNTDPGVCTYTQPDATLDPVTADNCPTILTYVLSGATSGSGSNTLANVDFNTGVTTVTWTLDDSHGNTVTCSHQITVTDVELPLITQCGPGVNTTVSADPGVCNYTNNGTSWDATATDNCSVASIVYNLSGVTTLSGNNTLDGVVFNLGTTTVLWTVTDVNGNISTCTYDITVNDTELPVITCNQTTNLTLPADAGGCTYLNNGTSWDASATDNCGVASVIYTLAGATTGTGTSLDGVVFTGLTTVTWTATDDNGNTSTCSFDVLIEDTQVPTISCTSNQTVPTDAGVCTYTLSGTAWDATGTDNCTITFDYSLSGVTTGTGASLDGVSFNLGVTTVLWTVTDGAGNSATCSFTVTVNDTELPVITCSGDQAVNSDAGVCTYAHTGTAWDPTASDNCSQTVTYVMSGATTGTGGASIDGITFNGGITTIVWTTTDGSGNTATCSQTIEVDDIENPVITNCGLDANQTVIADAGVCTYTHSGTAWDAQATDNCNVSSITYTLSGATSGTGTSLDGEVFNLGTTTVLWTVLDDSLNSITCTFDVTVNDTELPLITSCGPGSNQTVTADNGVCSYTHSGTAWDALATDNCTVASIAYSVTGASSGSGTSLDGFTFNSGVSTVVWTVTDGSGNISTCTFDVTVEDNENPVVTSCGGNTTENVVADAGVCTYTHSGTAWNAAGTDNCAVATILATLSGATNGSALTTLDATAFNLGNTVVTWTITDLAGNTSSCSFTVSVTDTENPVVSCMADQSVNTDAGVCTYTVSGTTWDATSTDNCSSTISYSISGVTSGTGTSLDGVVFNLGVSTVTWTATDGAGNTDVCTQTVTVTDVELPVINCQTNQTASTDLNVCTYTHSGTAWDATGSDNCTTSYAYALSGVTSGSGTSLNGVTFNLGTTTVTWTATDGSGNTATCSFDVTVNDTQAPAFSNCGNGTNPTVLANAGVCTFTYTATGWNSAATDNCTLASVVYDLSGVTSGSGTSLTGVTFNLGVTTVTWTATDAAGNTTTCSFTVTVNELEAPVITTCGVVTSVDVVADPGVCTYTQSGTTWDAQATDNCIISSVEYTLTGSTTGTGLTTLDGVAFSTGTTNVLWTVTDGSGNTATCQYTVNVTDDQAPVIAAVLPDLTVECSPTAPEAVDNCGPVTGVSDFTTYSGDTVVVVTWTFTDASGNTATAVQTITYDDVTAPVVPIIPDAIAQCDTTISAATTTDACMGTIVGTTTDPLTYTAQGNYTVTWTFTDGNGNTSTASQNVIILDITDPTITAPPTVNIYPNNAGCTAIVADLGTPVTTDNCQVVSVTNDGLAAYPLGSTTVTWTVTDIAGNAVTATQTVNVLPLTSVLDTVACDVYISPDGIDLTQFGSGTYTAVIPGSFGCDSTITINLTLNQSSSSTITLAACDLYTAPDGAVYNNSGVYTAIIQNAAGCDSTITINLTIDSIETADIVLNDLVFTALQSTDVSYQWVSCDNGYAPVSGATLQSFDISQYPLPSGDYAVILTNNTCVDTSECVNISIETIIPQLVTPNGDGNNDVFEIQGVYDYPNNILEIYNRWGNMVYRQESYQNTWGGECTEGLTLGGDILPSGTYFYIFDKGLNDGNKPVKGYIFLTK